VKVPVTITHPIIGPIAENIRLTATSSYQRKNIISASVQGYIIRIDVAVGDHIAKGQPLFLMQTKESHALNNMPLPDSLRALENKVTITASAPGIVTSVLRQNGDYVQDGEQLCVIADVESFAFVLGVPYDYIKFVRIGESCELLLPDSSHFPARISKKLSTVDPASQTQNYLAVLSSEAMIPENIIAQINLPVNQKSGAVMLPKQTVLADETMRNFWVMQLQSDSMAVKVPVTKGIETDAAIEILSPPFSVQDRFVLTGNYGLEDSALVTIMSKAGE
jgi:multidrug efflux pump subunit AcrA (membrane-fusion protein)